MSKILVVTRGDFVTRLALDVLLRSSRHKTAVVTVSGDGRGRQGMQSLRALWEASEPHYFRYELRQFAFFKAAQWRRPKAKLDVAGLAESLGLPLLRAVKVNGLATLRFAEEFEPDLLVSVKCPQRIKSPLLTLAPAGSLNVHASLLPKYAGRAPHFWAMAQGEKESGSSVHYMTESFDAGNVLVQKKCPIEAGASAFETLVRLARLGGDALVEGMELALKGAGGCPQDDAARSYYSHPTKDAYREFRANGFHLVRWSEMRRVLAEDLANEHRSDHGREPVQEG